MKIYLRIAFSILLLLFLTGCVNKVKPTQDAEEKWGVAEVDPNFKPLVSEHEVPQRLMPNYEKLKRGGDRHAVLNYMHLGLNAMQLGYFTLAENSFDAAIVNVENVFSNSENAQKALSLWHSEGQKEFKGEPYERAMLFYYRGMLYYMAGDLENARACFRSCELQDAYAADGVYRCDFALAMALDGWCTMQLGDYETAKESFDRAKKLRPDWQEPKPGQNVLLLFETGTSPRKLADGLGHYELKFRRGKRISDVRVTFDMQGRGSYDAYPMEDIAWQASTRGGREIDKILKGKAVYKRDAARLGTTLTDIANDTILYAPLLDGGTGIASVVVGTIGMIGVANLASAANAHPWADVRYWANLPDIVHMKTMQLNPGSYNVQILFKDKKGRVLNKMTRNAALKVEPAKPAILWVRSTQQIVK